MLDHLLNLFQIAFDAPNDGGGGGKTPEEITREKLGGAKEPVDDDPPTPPAGEEEEDDDPPPPPAGADDEDDDDPTPPPSKKEGADDDAGGEDDDAGDDEFFFDPEKHVEGKPAHSNKFPTREKAEYAAIHKAEMLKEKLDEMEKEGVDRGAIPLPRALRNDPKTVAELTSLEIVHAMEDDELREFLNEADASRQRLDAKHKRVKTEKETRQAKNDFEQEQVELFDDLQKIMDVDEIKTNADKFSDLEKGKQLVKSKIEAKVKAELKEQRDDLAKWIDDVDSGEIEMGIKEFDAEKSRRMNEIARKEKEIREQYEPTLDRLEKVYNLAEKVETKQELSPEAKAKRMWGSFSEMQNDLEGDLELLADNADARAELVAAKNWAVQNAQDYNDLQHPSDWAQALKKGWPDHKAKVRAQKQREELEGSGGKKGDKKKEGEDDDIPKPGDQREIEGISDRNIHKENRKSLDKLVELTNATVH